MSLTKILYVYTLPTASKFYKSNFLSNVNRLAVNKEYNLIKTRNHSEIEKYVNLNGKNLIIHRSTNLYNCENNIFLLRNKYAQINSNILFLHNGSYVMNNANLYIDIRNKKHVLEVIKCLI